MLHGQKLKVEKSKKSHKHVATAVNASLSSIKKKETRKSWSTC